MQERLRMFRQRRAFLINKIAAKVCMKWQAMFVRVFGWIGSSLSFGLETFLFNFGGLPIPVISNFLLYIETWRHTWRHHLRCAQNRANMVDPNSPKKRKEGHRKRFNARCKIGGDASNSAAESPPVGPARWCQTRSMSRSIAPVARCLMTWRVAARLRSERRKRPIPAPSPLGLSSEPLRLARSVCESLREAQCRSENQTKK